MCAYRFVFLVCIVGAALPPGYEDELYCPNAMCLKRAALPHGWCGPKTHFYVCVKIDEVESESQIHPRGWGTKVDYSVRDNLIKDGWQIAKRCDHETNNNSSKSQKVAPEIHGLFLNFVGNRDFNIV